MKVKKEKPDFGKRFSREWWGNIWYYHKGAILIASTFLFLILLIFVLMPRPTEDDSAIVYLGNYPFSETQRLSIGDTLGKGSVDVNGDGLVSVTFATAEMDPYQDDDYNNGYITLAKQLFESSKADLFFMDDKCFKYFSTREELMDLSEFAKVNGIPQNSLVYNESGKAVGIIIQTLPIFEENNAKLNCYISVRSRPATDDIQRQAMYEQNLQILNKLLDGAQYGTAE